MVVTLMTSLGEKQWIDNNRDYLTEQDNTALVGHVAEGIGALSAVLPMPSTLRLRDTFIYTLDKGLGSLYILHCSLGDTSSPAPWELDIESALEDGIKHYAKEQILQQISTRVTAKYLYETGVIGENMIPTLFMSTFHLASGVNNTVSPYTVNFSEAIPGEAPSMDGIVAAFRDTALNIVTKMSFSSQLDKRQLAEMIGQAIVYTQDQLILAWSNDSTLHFNPAHLEDIRQSLASNERSRIQLADKLKMLAIILRAGIGDVVEW